jgi:hypothetical protein
MLACRWARSSSGNAPALTKDSSQPLPSVSSPPPTSPTPNAMPLTSETPLPSLSQNTVLSCTVSCDEATLECFSHFDGSLVPCAHMLPFFVVKALWSASRSDPVLSSWLSLVGIEPNPGPGAQKKKPPVGKVIIVQQAKAKRKGGKSMMSHSCPPVSGRSVGSAVGGWVGDMAVKAIKSITGFGDYKVSRNSLVNSNQIPQFSINSRSVLVRHREYVGNVVSPGPAFTTTTFLINPTTSLFPWLSELANSFEQFRLHGMVVEFKSTSADAISATNTALGSVILATQYNVNSPPFSTQQQMEAYDFVTSCKPSESMIHPIECAVSPGGVAEFYVDTGYGGDSRLSFLGATILATVGQQAASTLGELWVSYDIELLKPKILGGYPSAGLSYGCNTSGVGQTSGGNQFILLNANFPPGSYPGGSDIDVWFPLNVGTSASYTTVSFPAGISGAYLLRFYWYGNSGVTIGIGGNFIVGNGASICLAYYTGATPHSSAYAAFPQVSNPNATALSVEVLAVFGGNYPLYGGPTSIANGQRPFIVYPQFAGPLGNLATGFSMTPISYVV